MAFSRSNEIDMVKAIVRNNPKTFFIWSPMYITDHTPERYDTYAQSKVFEWTEPYLRMVDLWDMARFLLNPGGGGLYHAPIGGVYMGKAMQRIWNEVETCMQE